MFWDKNGLYENLRELHHLTYRSVLLLSRGSCCMVDGRQRWGLGAPSRSLRQGLVCILVVIEGLNTKQHYNSFSEECHFIYYIFFMKCECLPCAPLLKWGHPLSCHHISILLRSPPDPVKSMMDSNWSKVTQSRLFGQRNLVKVRAKSCFGFFVMFEDWCLCNWWRSGVSETEQYCILHHRLLLTCQMFIFWRESEERRYFFPNLKKKKKK